MFRMVAMSPGFIPFQDKQATASAGVVAFGGWPRLYRPAFLKASVTRAWHSSGLMRGRAAMVG